MCSDPKPCGGPEDMGGCAGDVARVHTARDGLIHALLWMHWGAVLCRSGLLKFIYSIPLRCDPEGSRFGRLAKRTCRSSTIMYQ